MYQSQWYDKTLTQVIDLQHQYPLNYTTIYFKEPCELLHILPLSFRKEMMKSLFHYLCLIFLIVLHHYRVTMNLTEDFGPDRKNYSFIRDKSESRLLKNYNLIT